MTRLYAPRASLPVTPVEPEATRRAIAGSVDYLFSRQSPDGAWFDQLSSSAIATGTALIALSLFDQERFTDEILAGTRWLRETQQPDGSWGDATVDNDSLNGSACALAALQLLDPQHSQDAIRRGMAYIEARGGLDAVADVKQCSLNVHCLVLLALAGLCEWRRVPRIPLGIFLLPHGLRKKVSFTLPAILSWGLWHARTRPGGWFRQQVNRICAPRALAWLRGVQAENGGIEEAPIMVAVVIINLLHAHRGEDIVEKGIAYLLSTRRPDGSWAMDRSVDFSATNAVVSALAAAGKLTDPRLEATRAWIIDAQWKRPFAATGAPAGGWAWGTPSGWPNTDDTANAITVLRLLGLPIEDEHIQQGLAWLGAMQSRNGSWACFVRNPLTFTIDGPCPGFTAHALLALAASNYTARNPLVRRALRYLQRAQRPDGSLPCTWYRNYVSGTAFTLEAYAALGLSANTVATRCQHWLVNNQNADGSWGGVFDQTWRGEIGPAGTVEETSWALLALLKSGYAPASSAIQRGIAWLIQAQRADGSWPQSVVGIYFNAIYYSDDLLANAWALQALGIYRQISEALAQTGQPGQEEVRDEIPR
jgi:squalene-hopene/tetraprenyl-beta-curcumene cyclase